MTPGPIKSAEEIMAKLSAYKESLKVTKNELDTKVEQAKLEHKFSVDKCLGIFIYERTDINVEFCAYYAESENIELETMIQYQKVLLAGFERRKALANDFVKRFSTTIDQNKEREKKAKRSLEEASEIKDEKPLEEINEVKDEKSFDVRSNQTCTSKSKAEKSSDGEDDDQYNTEHKKYRFGK